MTVSPLEHRLLNQQKMDWELLARLNLKIDFLVQQKYRLEEKLRQRQEEIELLGRERCARETLRSNPGQLISLEQLVLARFGKQGLAVLEEMKMEQREVKEVRV